MLEEQYKIYFVMGFTIASLIIAVFIQSFDFGLEVEEHHKMFEKRIVDPSSFSRPDLAYVNNINLTLDADFNKKIFKGYVLLTVLKKDESVTEIIFDSKDLKIENIVDNKLNTNLNYTIDEPKGEFGSKITIQLPAKASNEYEIRITYESSPGSSGLQWLEPEQTAGKKHPYVYSQFQAIAARSFLPCQDTPSVKSKYQAQITAPSDLTVLMSAHRTGKTVSDITNRTTYNFKLDVPIQSYLIALAIGHLSSKQIGPRSHIWCEPEFLDQAAYEFAKTEDQLRVAEELCGPYVWGIYDLLVLPPSFPFGGMENPCLTFVTPTLLAGDRSLSNVIAHEIAHSWTGNLVTNANFEHFWLNEGFTVFVERKILGRLENKQVQDMQAYGGISALKETINTMGKDNPLTSLVVDLSKGVHPDDAFSTVPYEKGHIFLRYLESLIGGPDKFEPFLRSYFEKFKYQSLVTDDFKTFFLNYFKDVKGLEKIDWKTWLFSPGMPPVIPEYDISLLKVVNEVRAQWLNFKQKDICELRSIDDLNANQVIHILQDIIDNGQALPITQLELLDEKYKLSDSKNSEIKFRWFRIGIKAKWDKVLEPTLCWLREVGRMKFVRPLYRDLYGWEEVRQKTIDNFQSHRKYMMHVTAYTVSKDLKLTE